MIFARPPTCSQRASSEEAAGGRPQPPDLQLAAIQDGHAPSAAPARSVSPQHLVAGDDERAVIDILVEECLAEADDVQLLGQKQLVQLVKVGGHRTDIKMSELQRRGRSGRGSRPQRLAQSQARRLDQNGAISRHRRDGRILLAVALWSSTRRYRHGAAPPVHISVGAVAPLLHASSSSDAPPSGPPRPGPPAPGRGGAALRGRPNARFNVSFSLRRRLM